MSGPIQNGSPATNEAYLERALAMQAELGQFVRHLESVYEDYYLHYPKTVHKRFHNELSLEITTLRRRVDAGLDAVSGSNFPFLRAVWEMAKRCRGIVTMRYPVEGQVEPGGPRHLAPGFRIKGVFSLNRGGEDRRRQRTSFVDVIADGGLSWYKVSSMDNRRIIFDLADEGVYYGDSDSDSGEAAADANGLSTDYSETPLVKLARDLKRAADGHQIQHRSPTPNLFLPRVSEHEHPQIHRLVQICRDMGVAVTCGDALPRSPPSEPLSRDLLDAMVPGPRTSLTPTLNIDTSVLVTLVSDITHLPESQLRSKSRQIMEHVRIEQSEPMIPRLCSVFGGRELVCTREAANSMAAIAHHMGTNTENARAHLLLASDDTMTREQRVDAYRALSIHSGATIPSDLRLPVRIIDTAEDGYQARFSQDTLQALEILEQPTRTVFSYGWARDITTVTTNNAAVRQLERTLESLSDVGFGSVGWPSVWTFPNSRPLLGVPRDHTEPRVLKHVGDCRVSCTCGLEKKMAERKTLQGSVIGD